VKLSKYLKSDFIEPNLTETEKDPVLEQLVRLALPCIRLECPAEEETVLAALRERESITSTGIGNGVAIPHAKIPGLKKMALVLARSVSGVNFEALDLKLLAAISSFVKNLTNRNALLSASTKSDLLAAIKAGEAI
jgi:PTS system nitrogen regulatory IIA component